jgi:hypothetical protein
VAGPESFLIGIVSCAMTTACVVCVDATAEALDSGHSIASSRMDLPPQNGWPR